MPRRLLLALLLLVAAPLVLLGWVSATAMRESQQRAQKQIVSLLRSRLVEIDQSTTQLFETYSRQISIALDNGSTPIDALKKLRRSNPVVRQGIFVSSDGQLLFPQRPSLDDPDAVALYAALPGMISGRPMLRDGGQMRNDMATSAMSQIEMQVTEPVSNNPVPSKPIQEPPQRSPQRSSSRSNRSPTMTSNAARISDKVDQYSRLFVQQSQSKSLMTGESVWQVWYLDQGMQLILWLARDDGAAAGVILERPRWASDLTSVLPDSAGGGRSVVDAMPGFTALVDESKQIVYRWGDEGECTAQPTATLGMSAPLTSWQWEFHNTAELIPKTSTMPLLLSLVGVGVVLLALGAYVLSSVQRQMRTARNRVSFAGQVSHELRTPLTNIRLYAELADSDLDDLPASEARDSLERRLKVIDTESKRLGRLVSGVLEMMRHGKKQRGPRLALANPSQLINETLCQFAPSFQKAGIEMHREIASDQSVQMDADIFEMVLVNLLSNVEKYAADGKYVMVRSRIENEELIVSVADHGQGIGRQHQRTIFRPFARLDDSIRAPSGTGIGLTIARSAAVRHGGRLDLVASEEGACFELRIPVSVAQQPDNVGERA